VDSKDARETINENIETEFIASATPFSSGVFWQHINYSKKQYRGLFWMPFLKFNFLTIIPFGITQCDV
jgi:hypothetical protein